MNNLLNLRKLPRAVLALSVAGYSLRRLFYSMALDHKGLLISHPVGWVLAALSSFAIALVVVCVLRWDREPLAPLWRLDSSLPTCLMAAGVATLALDGGFSGSTLTLVRNILAILSALSLLAVPVLEKKGKEVPFFLYGVVCILLAIHMVSSYQLWSSNPQIQDYLYSLLGGVGLMLYSYFKTAAAVGLRKEKRMLAIGMLTSFFCFVALSDTAFPVLYLCGGFWTLMDLPHAVSQA